MMRVVCATRCALLVADTRAPEREVFTPTHTTRNSTARNVCVRYFAIVAGIVFDNVVSHPSPLPRTLALERVLWSPMAILARDARVPTIWRKQHAFVHAHFTTSRSPPGFTDICHCNRGFGQDRFSLRSAPQPCAPSLLV